MSLKTLGNSEADAVADAEAEAVADATADADPAAAADTIDLALIEIRQSVLSRQ